MRLFSLCQVNHTKWKSLQCLNKDSSSGMTAWVFDCVFLKPRASPLTCMVPSRNWHHILPNQLSPCVSLNLFYPSLAHIQILTLFFFSIWLDGRILQLLLTRVCCHTFLLTTPSQSLSCCLWFALYLPFLPLSLYLISVPRPHCTSGCAKWTGRRRGGDTVSGGTDE